MSFGKMNTPIEILSLENIKDSEGFVRQEEKVIAAARAYFEQRNTTERWRNLSEVYEINALFRLRFLPRIELTNKHYIRCGGKLYNIFSIENIKNRDMYYEILAVSVDGEY